MFVWLHFLLVCFSSLRFLLFIFTKHFFCGQIWLGGTPNQSTLAETFMNKVKLQDIEKVLEPLFSYWNSTRQEGESFGSFTRRTVSNLSANTHE